MIVISSREFRDNQAAYFDKADNGDEILVQRGKDKAYRIMPITKNDTIIDNDFVLAPDVDLANAITADELLSKLIPRIEKLFDK